MALDMDWVKSQLQAARVRKVVGDATMKLIDTFEEIELTDEQKTTAVEMFSKLALGHAHVKDKKTETWVDARPGAITIADVVRVKSDAFNGETGTLHNGRVGKVVGVRYGDVIFRSTDGKEPVLDGAHYSPHMLEKLVIG